MRFFPLRIHQNRAPDPTWELTVLPGPPSWFQGGRFVAGGNGREGGSTRGGEKGKERGKGEWEREGKGEVGG